MNINEVINKIKEYRQDEQAHFNEDNTLAGCKTLSLCDYVLALLDQVNPKGMSEHVKAS